MLLGQRAFDVDEIGIHRRSWSIDANGLWIRLVRQEGMGADESLVRLLGYGRGDDARNLVGICLGGRSPIRVGEKAVQEISAGDVVLVPGRASYRSRLEPEIGPSFSMTIELSRETWSSAPFAPSTGSVRDVSRLSEKAASLCRAIDEAWRDPSARPVVEHALDDLFALLRSEGVPLPSVDPGALPPPPPSVALVSRALDVALSRTRSRAALVDVELGGKVSARTFQRWLPALCRAWGQSVESFRDHSRRDLLARACWAMTNPRATTELIARAVGFSTPNAFCRAMARYGLPSPGRVRERFVALA